MENNTNIEVELRLLQKQVDDLQKKASEEKPKWYKTPSIVLSILALTSSVIFSTRSIIKDINEKKEERASSALATIKNSIGDLVEEEDKYLKFSSNAAMDMMSKSNAGMVFEAKTGNIIDRITKIIIDRTSKKVDTNYIKHIEPNLLLSYARFLQNKGRFSEAKDILENAINSSKDSLTIGICYRTLANIYSNPSNPDCDSLISRKYRKTDIDIANTFRGDAKFSYLTRSYELWSMDEYFFFKNTGFGNKLIDSARRYANMFSDINVNKKVILNKLGETYSFYNSILVTSSNLNGEYSFYSSDGKKGTAFISANAGGIFLNIDFINDNQLYCTLKGPGNIIDFSHVKFNATTESVDFHGAPPKYSGGSLNLETAKDYKLTGSFFEYGKKPVKFILTKKV